MKRVALIDLGSNSVRFVISEITDSGSYRLVYQQKESIRLSEGMWTHQMLTKPAMDRAIKTLKSLSHMARDMGVTEIQGIATAAVRLATNGNSFIRRVYAETGIPLRAISGEEEAYLGFLGVVNTIGLDDFIVFDLGGASIEISLIENRQLKKSVSLPMGALVMTGQFKLGHEFTKTEYEAMVDHIQSLLKRENWLKDAKLPLIGIGGTARNIAKMDQREKNYPIPKLHNYKVKKTTIEALFQRVKETPWEERKKIPGLSSERADIIVAGMAIIRELMEYTKASSMIVSGCGLREGLFFQYYGQHYDGQEFLQKTGIIDDIVTHSTLNILRSFTPHDVDHSLYIAKLAKQIYKQWKELMPEGERLKLILKVASLLHDLGKQINYYSHARHSAYMIINSNLYGLSHREQLLSAFIASYSHGANSKFIKQSPYLSLLKEGDREIIQKLSFPLAIAEALEESHERTIYSIQSHIRDRQIDMYVEVKTLNYIPMMEMAIEKLKKQCKKEFKRELVIHWKVR
ncbi:Ppx/GppA phosphatase family protein [Veillonella sp. VA142]|uniref:Ppx/GppA phosphatase family protein n=1 Tax=Veillonella sp. VA142 TaxID=741834 RepID=UPI000F8CA776|nr:Ppx/GppA phosphatase family protein [Veillonella sp. VA142]